jgi:hypothetical protein
MQMTTIAWAVIGALHVFFFFGDGQGLGQGENL